jgi:DNA-binding NtrC family response regulator
MAKGYEPKPRVLLVEDDESLRLTQALYLEREGFVTDAVGNFQEAHQRLSDSLYELVVTDLRLGESSGLDVLKDVRNLQSEAEILIITGYGSVETAVAAMKQGAYDYLTKPVDPEHLVRMLRKALERQQLRRQVSYLREQIEQQAGLNQMVAVSPSMRRIIHTIDEIAASDASVMIEGESGTGKELLAKIIHQRSSRAGGPFLGVNCGAMPESLLESELFGHMRGSFTGAHKDHKGLFEAAHGGTLFLDEVAETTTTFQVKLLRTLQERTIRRVGDTREIAVDVRIIAASNQNLGQLARDGRFRQDLFFRLKVIPIHLPPLRERREDILPLTESCLVRFSNRMGRRPPGVTEAAREKLLNYSWPGNVRELENVLERALIFNKGNPIGAGDLLLDSGLSLDPAGSNADADALLSLAELEKRHILQVLSLCRQNKSQASRILGIGYNTLWRKLSRYGFIDHEH